jgi:hypothetical protein
MLVDAASVLTPEIAPAFIMPPEFTLMLVNDAGSVLLFIEDVVTSVASASGNVKVWEVVGPLNRAVPAVVVSDILPAASGNATARAAAAPLVSVVACEAVPSPD